MDYKKIYKKYNKVFSKYMGIGIFLSVVSLVLIVFLVDVLHLSGIYVWFIELSVLTVIKFAMYIKFDILKSD